MSAIELPITNGYYVSMLLPISHQRCSNVYPSIPSKPALSKEQLLFTPGTRLLTTTGQIQQINRGSHVKNGVPYFVNGDTLWRIDRVIERVAGIDTEIFSATSLGTIKGVGEVSMADNGTQLIILVPGGKGYIYNEDAGTPFEEITDSDFTASGYPQIVVFVDGYFLMTTDSKKIIISNLNNGLVYDALDFASAESDPDSLVAPVVLNNLVYVLGTETTEGFQNLPSVGRMPFVRNGVILDKGCKAPFSVVKSNSSFFMVGAGVDESPAIWQFFQGSYRKKSTDVIEQLLASYSETQIEAISSFAYSEAGSYFVAFNLPNTTLCFDIITERWHERNSYLDGSQLRSRISSVVTAYGKLLVGDSIDGRIGHLSINYAKEYENNITRLFTTQPFSNQGNEVTSTMLELTMEAGVGNSDVPDPVVSFSSSSNAKTFSNERVRKIGKKGEYHRRTIWYKNGRQDRFVVYLFRMSEPIKSAFIKLEYEP